MPFPTLTHSSLSTFTGDENPLSEGGIWVPMSGWPGVTARKVSGQMAQASGGDTYWTSILDSLSYGDFEAIYDLPTFNMANQALDFMWKIQPTGITYSTRDCYVLYTTTDGSTFLIKLVDNVETVLDSDSSGLGTWVAGDKVGIQSKAGVGQSVWRYRSSTWTEIVSSPNEDYASGKFALGGFGATMRLDNLTIGAPVLAAPGTGVLDSFNAGATQLLTARSGWSPSGFAIAGNISWRTDAVPTVADNTNTPATQHSNMWGTQFAADQEAWFTYGAGIDDVWLICRGAALGNGTTFYNLVSRWNGVIQLQKNGVTITSMTQAAPNAGDSFALQVVGSNLYAWCRRSGGSWTRILTANDTTYAGAGYIGFLTLASSVATVTEFGGGAVVGVTLDSCLPDADVVTTGWSTAPLFSKVNDASDATVIQATAV